MQCTTSTVAAENFVVVVDRAAAEAAANFVNM